MNPPAYQCSVCKQGVVVLPDGQIVRRCKCKGPVIANMSATVSQDGAVKTGGR